MQLSKSPLFVRAACFAAACAGSVGIAHAAPLTGSFSVHDPSRITQCDGKYYVYYTGPHCPMHYSTDLVHWVDGKNALGDIPDWARKAVPLAKGSDPWIWAPDVIKVGDLYYMFWSFSTFGSKVSAIGLMVSPTLDPSDPHYRWQDRGMIVSSNEKSDYNAIDPCPIFDARGDLWMSFGSWNRGGIQIVKLDKATGMAVTAPKRLSAGQAAGPEASFVYFHKGFYYLFDNEGTCCQGTHSTYHVMMGRSKSITGPYLDKDGRDMARGGGSMFMAGSGDIFGPGQVGISTVDGQERLSYHYYDGAKNGWPEMGINRMMWEASGWPQSPWQPTRTIADGDYAIVSKSTGLALTIDQGDNGAAILQSPLGGTPRQTWRVESTQDGFYKVISLGTGKALDLWSCNAADGTKIDQYSWFDNACQHWKISKTGSDMWSIVSMGGGGAITTATKDSIAGTPVLEYAYHGDPGQQWEFKPIGAASMETKVSRSQQ